MRTDGAFGRRSLTFSFIAPRSDASRFRSFGPITRHSAGLFYVSPKLRAFFLSFSLSFLQITPVTMPIHTPHFVTKNARLESGLMPQPSSAFGSAGDGRSAGVSAKPCCDAVRPIRSPLYAIIRKPWPALKRRSAGQTSMPGALRRSRPLRPTVRFGQMKRSVKGSLPEDWH